MKVFRVLIAALILGGLILSFTGCGKSSSSGGGMGLRSRTDQMNGDDAGSTAGGSGSDSSSKSGE